MTTALVDLEFHLKVEVDVSGITCDGDIFERAYEAAMQMDADYMKYNMDLEYWEVVE